MICTCEWLLRCRLDGSLMIRNDKLNYYKFGLGLGIAAVPAAASGRSREGGGASEAAAGTADQ